MHMWAVIDLSRIPTNNGTESRLGWTKIQQMYENVHPSLALVLLIVRTEVECGKGLLHREATVSIQSRNRIIVALDIVIEGNG